ncbi:hypothetical protein QAD02_021343 [Eretmocerus hayati]|uniref:Uncharacterized protein n=1 Tax=Eretmocerus hayati TaxID=131215 RepID=A0ACC2PQ72_9HYME|nr:hypothetical protein QAD02_021343 [Eretmocerus hayati]
MAFRNLLTCFICEGRFPPQNMSRIDGDQNAHECEIAINWREGFDRPALKITPLTRICFVCNRSILQEIRTVQENPMCVRLNVLARTRTSSCFICNAQDNIHRLFVECKANVFSQRDIFIPHNVRSCRAHLDQDGFILRPLLDGIRSINQPCIILGPYLAPFLESMRTVSRKRGRFHDPLSFDDNDFVCLTLLRKDQFEDLFTFCDAVPCQGGYRYVKRLDLIAFLAKLHQVLSDEFLEVLFEYSTRQATSLAMATARQSLMQRFVPTNIGFGSITREEFIQRHVTEFANVLYNPHPEEPQAILIIDGTYSYIFKSMNFRVLRQTYSHHKGRHLAKPALIVGPDGHIVGVQDPHFADARNNDAAMLREDLGNEDGPMRHWNRAGDIILVDRAYRGIEDLFEELGLRYHRPAFLEAGERQLSTQDANQSRIVTKMRWIVEARDGHIKSTCKFLNQMMQIQHIPHLGDFHRIAGAMINLPGGCWIERGNQMPCKQGEQNENLAARNAQRWVRLDDGQLNDFPILTKDYLKDLTFGVYQVGLAPSYVQDKLQRDEGDEMQIEMLRDHDRLPEPGLLRVRLYSLFQNASKYQLRITYTPAANDDAEHQMEVDAPPIEDYYCTCMSGARTLGTCARVVCVMWYLGFARHDPNVHYLSQILLDTIADAAHRPRQINPD